MKPAAPTTSRPRRPLDGWIAALCVVALAGAIVAFVKLDRGQRRADASAPRLAATAPPERAVAGEPIRAAAAAKADDGEESDEQAWRQIAATIGTPGMLKDGVYTVVVPRTDLTVTLRGNDVPAAAGLESRFGFYRCACGRMNVVGQFVVADYEANDVLDALRRVTTDGTELEIASVAPLLLYEKPRLTVVRFQGEAIKSADLARPIKSALDRTGKARSNEQPLGVQ